MACCAGCAKKNRVEENVSISDINKVVSSIEPKGKNATLTSVTLSYPDGTTVPGYSTSSTNGQFMMVFSAEHRAIAIVRKMAMTDRWFVEPIEKEQTEGVSVNVVFTVDESNTGKGIFKITEHILRLRDRDATKQFLAEYGIVPHSYKEDSFTESPAVNQIFEFLKLSDKENGMWPLLITLRPNDGPHVTPSMYVKIPGWFDDGIWK